MRCQEGWEVNCKVNTLEKRFQTDLGLPGAGRLGHPLVSVCIYLAVRTTQVLLNRLTLGSQRAVLS